MTSAKLYIYIGVGARDLHIDEAHTMLDIFCSAAFFIPATSDLELLSQKYDILQHFWETSWWVESKLVGLVGLTKARSLNSALLSWVNYLSRWWRAEGLRNKNIRLNLALVS